MGCRCINRLQGDCRKTWPQIRFLITSYSDLFIFLPSIIEKHFLDISCGIQRPFVFVTKLLNTLLMCFQDAATSFSLKAELNPNYSHFEVSSMVKTFSHDAVSVTYILITCHPENCSPSATHSQQLFI